MQVSDVEFATMAEQCARLSENIKLCSGLSERVIEVTKSEAVHALDIQSRAKDGHKLHAGGRLLARQGPKSIADDDSAQKRRGRDGVARVYPPLGGSDQPDLPYDKPDLEIKGVAVAHLRNDDHPAQPHGIVITLKRWACGVRTLPTSLVPDGQLH